MLASWANHKKWQLWIDVRVYELWVVFERLRYVTKRNFIAEKPFNHFLDASLHSNQFLSISIVRYFIKWKEISKKELTKMSDEYFVCLDFEATCWRGEYGEADAEIIGKHTHFGICTLHMFSL